MTASSARRGHVLAELPAVQRVSALLWPSFLLACAATVVFFAFIDPLTLRECAAVPPLSRTGAYSLGFFGFWLLTGASSAASYYFLGTRVPAPKRVDLVDED